MVEMMKVKASLFETTVAFASLTFERDEKTVAGNRKTYFASSSLLGPSVKVFTDALISFRASVKALYELSIEAVTSFRNTESFFILAMKILSR